MKTIDIKAKEWFDKANGNSYFAAFIAIDYGMESEQRIFLPFQYGYGDQYEWESFKELQKIGLIPPEIKCYRAYFHENGIVLRSGIQRNCLKRDLVNI
jgi:hypothetical protein